MTQKTTLSIVPLKTSHWAVELVEKHPHYTTAYDTKKYATIPHVTSPLPKKHLPYGCLHLSPGICFRFPGLFLSHLRRHGSGLFRVWMMIGGMRAKPLRDRGETGEQGPRKRRWRSTFQKGQRSWKKTLTWNGTCWVSAHIVGYVTWEGVGLIHGFLTLGHIFTYTSKHQDSGFVVGNFFITYLKKRYTLWHYDLNHFLRDLLIPKLKMSPASTKNYHPASSHLHRRGLLASTVCVPTRLGTF